MDIMQTILEIEKKAQGIIDSAENLKAENDAQIELEIENMKSSADAKVKTEISQLVQISAAERQEAINAIEIEYRKRIEDLDLKCKNNKSKWVSEITQSILVN
ncbi:MAG: hypothetical protein RSB38_08340 [Oscillospiraceae bacterium]